MIETVKERPNTVRDQIHEMAEREGIAYVAGPFDQLADIITAHSGDEVTLDATEELLIALETAGVLGPLSATFLHADYLRERRQ